MSLGSVLAHQFQSSLNADLVQNPHAMRRKAQANPTILGRYPNALDMEIGQEATTALVVRMRHCVPHCRQFTRNLTTPSQLPALVLDIQRRILSVASKLGLLLYKAPLLPQSHWGLPMSVSHSLFGSRAHRPLCGYLCPASAVRRSPNHA